MILIEAIGWGHFLHRIRGTVKSHGVPPSEIAYNVALASGMDPSAVRGYAPEPRRYKVTKAIKGMSALSSQPIGGDVVEPLVGSDESTIIRLLGMQVGAKPSHAWAADTLASTGVVAPSFWEAVDYGSSELFETIALIQYQWISGDMRQLAGSHSFRFRPYWRTPKISLSDPTLARQLDDTKAMALSRPRATRRAGRLSRGEVDEALERATHQARALQALPAIRRNTLRNALHLFVRATEARDWPSALLFYSAAGDELANLAPKKTLLSRKDRDEIVAASEAIFTADDPRHRRVIELLKKANQRTFRERLADVAESCGVELSKRTLKTVDDLYTMRNLFAHAGYHPPSNILYMFTTGLSVLDQILSRLISQAVGEAGQ